MIYFNFLNFLIISNLISSLNKLGKYLKYFSGLKRMKIKMQAKMDYLLIDLIGASINYYIINNLLTVKFNHEKICSDKCYN